MNKMSTKRSSTGVVMCPDCKKTVTDSIICGYCGSVLKDLPFPVLSPMEIKILMCLNDGATSVDEILKCAGGTIESIRVTLSKILKFGVISRTRRGNYTLTKVGEWAMKRDTIADNSR